MFLRLLWIMQDPEHLFSAFEAYKKIQKVFEHLLIEESIEGSDAGDSMDLKSFEQYSRLNFYPICHPVGTCKMGDHTKDHLSVVDHELKVYGLKGLRVIDGSVMPKIPTANTMAPIIMIGEKGAEMIIDEYGVNGWKKEYSNFALWKYNYNVK